MIFSHLKFVTLFFSLLLISAANASSLPNVKLAQPVDTCPTTDLCIYLKRDWTVPESRELDSNVQFSYSVMGQPYNDPFVINWSDSNIMRLIDILPNGINLMSNVNVVITRINNEPAVNCAVVINGPLSTGVKSLLVTYYSHFRSYSCKPL